MGHRIVIERNDGNELGPPNRNRNRDLMIEKMHTL